MDADRGDTSRATLMRSRYRAADLPDSRMKIIFGGRWPNWQPTAAGSTDWA